MGYTAGLAGNKLHKGDLYNYGYPVINCSSYLFKLTTNSGAIVSAGGPTPSATRKKLKITIDGTTFWLLAATDWT